MCANSATRTCAGSCTAPDPAAAAAEEDPLALLLLLPLRPVLLLMPLLLLKPFFGNPLSESSSLEESAAASAAAPLTSRMDCGTSATTDLSGRESLAAARSSCVSCGGTAG